MSNSSLRKGRDWFLVYDCWTSTAIPAHDHRTKSICLRASTYEADEAELRKEAFERWEELPKNDGVKRANPRLRLEIWLDF